MLDADTMRQLADPDPARDDAHRSTVAPRFWMGVASVVLALAACTSAPGLVPPCTDGETRVCACADGASSTQRCSAGSFQQCACAARDAGLDAPPSEASATIGPEGGALSSIDSAVELRIPPGALSAPVTIRIGPAGATAAGAVGRAYEIGPSGTRFSSAATVAFRYDPAALGSVDARRLTISTFVDGAWQPLEGVAVNSTEHVVTGATTHLSTYALTEVAAVTDGGSGDDGATPDATPAADAPSGPFADLYLYRSNGITPLAGARACVTGHPELPCVTTDSAGSALLAIPADVAFEIEISRAGYVPLLIPSDTRGESVRPHLALLSMLTTGEAALLAAAVGTTIDPAMGFVYFAVINRFTGTGVADCTASLSTGSGTGPVYFARSPDPSIPVVPALGAQDTSLGSGFFYSVAPGEVEITFGNGTPSPMCPFRKIPGWGWGTSQTNRYRIPVRAGHVSAIDVWCA